MQTIIHLTIRDLHYTLFRPTQTKNLHQDLENYTTASPSAVAFALARMASASPEEESC